MRILLITCCLFLSLSALAQPQATLLRQSYTNRSVKGLKLFIDRWVAASSALNKTKKGKVNDTLQALRGIYRDLLENRNRDISFRKDYPSTERPAVYYLVLDDQLRYSVVDSFGICPDETTCMYELPRYDGLSPLLHAADTVERVLKPWYPVLPDANAKVLLLTDQYHDLLEDFLRDRKEGKLPGEKTIAGHQPCKVDFLQNYLPMVKRHWGEYWHYRSFPDIRRIILNRELTRALVEFKMTSSGEAAYYIKENGNWKLVNTVVLTMQ